MSDADHLRIATYNSHKGVQGIVPRQRLEIHNLGLAVEQLDADIVCLQEVRKLNRREAVRFAHWPVQPQAEYLAPPGYEAVYRTNAITKHGEHGNAMLSRWPVEKHSHEDMSDHRFEQRGLLHSQVWMDGRTVHVIVIHLGLLRASRVRQLTQLKAYIGREVPLKEALVVAGDFNEGARVVLQGLDGTGLRSCCSKAIATFPSRLPLVQLDHILVRGLKPVDVHVPRGAIWAQMSDHLPLMTDLRWEEGA